MYPEPVEGLDAAATLRRAQEVVARRRVTEAEDLRVVAHWADLHASDPRLDPAVVAGERPCWDRLVRPGGPGTPGVRELCIAELAIARGVHVIACESAVADALDLIHRLPGIWAAVQAGACEVWLARKVAGSTRPLALDAVGLIDDALAEAITTQAPGRVLGICEAKVIEADPDAHARRVAAARRARYARFTDTDETGLRLLIAKVTAGDAALLDAMLDYLADQLRTSHPLAGKDERRSLALGLLATPAEALAVMLQAQQETATTQSDDSPDQAGAAAGGNETVEPTHDQTTQEADPDPEPEPEELVPEPEEPAAPYTPRPLAFPADLLAALESMDPKRLRPQAVLYLHLHEAAVRGVSGVARVEGVGPLLPVELQDLLDGAHVTLKPVIDLNERVSVNAYEHPEAVKERVLLTSPGEYFPYSTTISRRVDLDHVTPYDPTGPPGQTGTHNTGPLTRRRHLVKTHAGYHVKQLGPAEHIWRTPHGDYLIVDHHGTHRIPKHFGDRICADTAG